ncbi:hypothetical protein PV729_04245 [Streptomyces europaeiscabiei]|uniref:Uncharacterized protein n=1 Tax=Streptomyces europaeiscabiei TaxID=146819 RepID=A0ABU4N763_9ACTN|nr:hypothetical protein [Streptomyces europaeiscabiei]MDX3550988.1 hypothetical protein [Streptomyces europaeiscabiei]MDX3698452.1 hypothetical protein [Streptomyces europaeiscabiei]
MTFPLDIRTELWLNRIWTDISADVYQRDTKRITRGRRDQGSVTDPARLTLTLNNAAGKYQPRNPMSPLYGQIGRNTRVRLSVPATDTFLQLEGDPDGYASTPDTAALDITGDLDVRADVAPNWYGPDNQVLIGKWEITGNQRSWLLTVQDGIVWLRISSDGTSAGVWTHGQYLPVLPERAVLRVTLDVNNGAGGHDVVFYWAESMSGPWTQIGLKTVGPAATSVFSSTAPLRVGLHEARASGPDRLPFVGRGYRFEVRNGIGGTLVASPDFTAQAAGATSFADSAGRTWTLNGGAEIRDREDRFVGEISEWPAQWTPDESDVFASVTASGILRRLGQGKKPLDSTLRRRIPSGDPIAYWPLEEGADATRGYSPVPGVQPASLSGVEWASWNTLPSSSALPRLTATAALNAPVPESMTPGEWHTEFVYTADDKAPPAAGPYAELISVNSPDGLIRRWTVSMRDGAARLEGFNSVGTALVNRTIDVGADVFHGWVRLRLYAVDTVPGSLFEYGLFWEDVGGTAGGISGGFAGTCGKLSSLTATWGALTDGWGIGHLTVLSEAGSTLLEGSDNAYSGEPAWDRLRRLSQEESVPMERLPGALETERVGPQRPEKLIDLFQNVAAADGGWLLENPRRVGLSYRDRSRSYAQDPVLTLSYNAAGLAPDLNPVDDDSAVRNDVTVTRDGGSSGRAYLAEGALSVQAPPDGIGVYDEEVTLSLSDDTQAEPIAYWLLHLGTFDGARYPSVTITLHKPGADVLVPQVLKLREGDKIRLTDLPLWLSPDDVDLIVEGISEELELYRWTITLNCSPGGPWNVATVSTVHEGFESEAASISLAAGGNLPWLRTAAQAHSGTYSLRSGAITNNQTSDATLTLPARATELSFWYRTSSENSGAGFEGDRLLVLVDGVQVLRAQGATAWTKITLNVTDASTVLFRYAKDNSAASGEDAVYIDDLRLILGANGAMKAGPTATALVNPIDADDTTFMAVTTVGELWTEAAVDMPIPIAIGGEVMTVTAIAAGVGVNVQQFTVTRSANGVAKAHAAGAVVQLANRYPASL